MLAGRSTYRLSDQLAWQHRSTCRRERPARRWRCLGRQGGHRSLFSAEEEVLAVQKALQPNWIEPNWRQVAGIWIGYGARGGEIAGWFCKTCFKYFS